jgi:predicted SprT family Zn-dependent metalloprotease
MQRSTKDARTDAHHQFSTGDDAMTSYVYMSVCEDHRLRVRVLYVCVRAAGEYYVIECTEGKKVRTTTSAG